VKKILRGYEREMTARFIAFRSHWQYETSFCTPGEGREKGGVEGEVGYFRRNHWVAVPAARDLADLNAKLFADCRQDENRMMAGRTQSVGTLLLIEKEHLFPLPAEDVDLAEVSVGFQKCLLRGPQICRVISRAAGHRSHREYLQLDPFSVQIGIRFVPVDLDLDAKNRNPAAQTSRDA
jgi:hypothetical protein